MDVEDDQAEAEGLRCHHLRRWARRCRQMIHSCLIKRLEALQRKRHQLHLEALRKERNQRRRKIIFNMMTRLQRKNLPHVSIMVRISLEIKIIQYPENFPSVLPTTTMRNGRVFTIKVIQLLVSIDTCSGIKNTGRPVNHTKTTGTPTLTSNWCMARHKDEYPLSLLEDLRKVLSMVARTLVFIFEDVNQLIDWRMKPRNG